MPAIAMSKKMLVVARARVISGGSFQEIHMSFENGSISFRIFHVPHRLPKDAVERFAQRAAPLLKSMGADPVHGWVGGRHLLDVPITDENAFFGGHLRLVLLKAERKVPKSLLRAECMLEEFAHMRAENKPFVDRKTRSDIRKQVMARLLPTMPPTLKGIPFVYDERSSALYAGATSENQTDAFRINFRNAAGFDPIPLTAGTAATQLGASIAGWGKTSFTPELPDSAMEETPGLDFLTWLWFASEARDGLFDTKEHGRVAVQLEGPLLFTRAGEGAHVMSLRDGLPTISAEAKTALLSGKKLERAKLILARSGDENWSCSFDTDAFVFRSLKLPESKEMLDGGSSFQDRIQKLGQFREMLLDLFEQFVAERGDPRRWAGAQKQIHRWVADRTSKR